ncbi:acyltransferase [Vibrio sp. JC009]|uniref:acyltransferase n=1 Tax=Vibrio sp. JC009 TaxID=2912314 RepID=UPI0023AFE3B8|nr:acyltransferase [Vibrio sp. JC009]WED23336.1 acyltransferase [Vibrio sp. JC009]
MFGYLVLAVTALLVIVNTAICSLMICVAAIFKLLLPGNGPKKVMTTLANKMMWLWATINVWILSLFNPVEWEIEGVDQLKKDGWYLMISNHLSWTDIVVLCSVFKDEIPMPKFFLKQQLLYVPFLGMACWALDMPFMRRYSREYLIRNPEKRGADLDSTRRSCARFKNTPTTVVNYVEGTRYTHDKKARSKSGYKNLLQPKSGGIAYTLAAMGEQFESIIDVTLAYPKNRENPFKALLMGKMEKIVVHVNTHPVDEKVLGDYFNDKPFKREFQLWLGDIWKEKDIRLEEIYDQHS